MFWSIIQIWRMKRDTPPPGPQPMIKDNTFLHLPLFEKLQNDSG